MTGKKRLILFLILLLSFVSLGTWLFEINIIKGWYGLNWLDGSLYSPYLACLIVGIAYLAAFFVNQQLSLVKTIIFMVILCAINVFCFKAGEYLCHLIYCRFCFWGKAEIYLFLFLAISLYLLVGFSYWFFTYKFIVPCRKTSIFYLAIVAFLAIPLSLVTIKLLPGFGHGTGEVDAVKMGYPIFWTTLLLGLSGYRLSNRK
jgi:hypothetical protein